MLAQFPPTIASMCCMLAARRLQFIVDFGTRMLICAGGRHMRRLLSATAIITLVGGLWTAADRRSGAHAADEHFVSAAAQTSPLTMTAHVQHQSSSAATTAPSPVLRQYCVGCHNDRMKSSFGNLSLEGIDVGNVSDHMESLEKVVRKLRKGQMPPEGRPRP